MVVFVYLHKMSGNVERNLLAERLREENYDQFLTLVRMHLSFVLDINTDDVDTSTEKPKQFKWGFQKKLKNNQNGQVAIASTKSSFDSVSIVDKGIDRVYELITFLNKDENVIQEGIFRRTGALSRQQELKKLLMSGSELNLDSGKFTVHDCASILKGFLAELPEPILMEQNYQSYCYLASQCCGSDESSEGRLLTALQLLVLLLPPLHGALLRRLFALLLRTADNEPLNRMSPDSLATMFTPHLLCPRRLPPEALHADAVALAPVVSFMIRNVGRLFDMPEKLATDIAAYFTAREKKRLQSPDIDLDESISDRTAANTVYTFVDRQRTTVENEANPTDTALAQLYAYIQSLPDSQHKRRLVKQFNRQNGYGTPKQFQQNQKQVAAKSFGDSIKKHIFTKGLLNKTPKKSYPAIEEKLCNKNNGSLYMPTTPQRYNDMSIDCRSVSNKHVVLRNLANQMALQETLDSNKDTDSECSNESTVSESDLLNKTVKHSPKFHSEPNLSLIEPEAEEITPKKTKCSSKIFRSRRHKPAQRKSAGGNKQKTETTEPEKSLKIYRSCVSCTEMEDSSSDTDSVKETIEARHKNRHLSRRESMKFLQYHDLNSPAKIDTPNLSVVTSKMYLTSTPGLAITESREELQHSTPYMRRASMSPITKSTQKLSKAMQESIMTPRSRKPLVINNELREGLMPVQTKVHEEASSSGTGYASFSPKNDSDFVSSSEDSCEMTSSNENNFYRSSKSRTNIYNYDKLLDNKGVSCISDKAGSLSSPFKEYMLNRSLLTGSPIDLSSTSLSNNECFDIPPHVTESMLYCLDGNIPNLNNVSFSESVIKHGSRNSLPSVLVENYGAVWDSEISECKTNSDFKRGVFRSLNNVVNTNLSHAKVSPSRKRLAKNLESNELTDMKKVMQNKENSSVTNEVEFENSWETAL